MLLDNKGRERKFSFPSTTATLAFPCRGTIPTILPIVKESGRPSHECYTDFAIVPICN